MGELDDTLAGKSGERRRATCSEFEFVEKRRDRLSRPRELLTIGVKRIKYDGNSQAHEDHGGQNIAAAAPEGALFPRRDRRTCL